jgi:cobalt-zinc-cadmium efflux system protein
MGLHHHHHTNDKATGNMRVAFFLNLIFAIFELIGGLYTNSIAILSDAVHDFGDSISLGIAWFLQKKSGRKSDEFYSYGYKRFSLLGAIFISVILIVSSFFILRESFIRLFDPQQADAQGMMLFAFVGIAVNGYAAYRMHGGKSFSERAVSLHLLEDVFGWVAVLVASIVMMNVEAPWLDPVLSIGITIWILSNVYKNLRNTFKVLMQEVPQSINVNGMLALIHEIPEVVGLHDFHLWSLDGEQNIMTLHVVTEKNISNDLIIQLKHKIRKVAELYGVSHVTLEFENTAESSECEFLDNC